MLGNSVDLNITIEVSFFYFRKVMDLIDVNSVDILK